MKWFRQEPAMVVIDNPLAVGLKSKENRMNQIVRFILIVTIVVSAVDITGFCAIKKYPEYLTIPFVVLMIVATIIPIGINIWYWLRQPLR